MTEEDDVFLKIMNQKRDPAVDPCTEDIFEEVMNFFEETAQMKQPYASVDNPPVLSFAEMEDTMDATLEDPMKPWAKEIYEHWKSRRTSVQNNPLVSQLKVCRLASNWPCDTANIVFLQFETGQDTDDSDPFVCFRRREVRQIRKTRGRDAQSAEKLRRLRKELEDARELVALVRQREIARKEMLSMERQLFKQRAEVKEMKRKLNIKDDDEDLINQKVRVPALVQKEHMLTPQTAEEKSARHASPTSQCSSIAHAPQGRRRCRRFAILGGSTGREGERDSARYQAEHHQAHQVERGIRGSHACTTISIPGADIRCGRFPTRIHGATAHPPIIRSIW